MDGKTLEAGENIEAEKIARLYYKERPAHIELIDSSRGSEDIRRTYLTDDGCGKKLAIHEAANMFTNSHRISSWAKLKEEYNRLGIYCPKTVPALDGAISRKLGDMENGVCRFVYAEEFSPYETAETIGYDTFKTPDGRLSYQDDLLRSVGKVAAAHLEVCDFPSAFCLLEPFCPPETTDEGTECAEAFRSFVNAELPEYAARTDHLLTLFYQAQDDVKSAYGTHLPVSCFQADLNYSNILIDGGRFKGVIDFNLSGREPIVNYALRLAMNYVNERCYDENGNKLFYFDEGAEALRVESILKNLAVIGEGYTFTDAERAAFPVLFRYMSSFWWQEVSAVKKLRKNEDREKLDRLFSWIELQLTREDVHLF